MTADTVVDVQSTKRSRGRRGGRPTRAKREQHRPAGASAARIAPPRATNSGVMHRAFLTARVRLESSDSPVVALVLSVLRAAL